MVLNCNRRPDLPFQGELFAKRFTSSSQALQEGSKNESKLLGISAERLIDA